MNSYVARKMRKLNEASKGKNKTATILVKKCADFCRLSRVVFH